MTKDERADGRGKSPNLHECCGCVDLWDVMHRDHPHCMQYIFETNEKERYRNSWRLGGRCVRYAIENSLSLKCERDWWIYNAAINGKLDLLIYLYDHGCRWTEEFEADNNGRSIYDRMIAYNRLEELKFVVEKDIENGYKPGLEYIKKTGCNLAAFDDSLDVLKYLHTTGLGNWNEKVYESFVAKPHNLTCLRYVHENGCPYTRETLERYFKGSKVRAYAMDCILEG
jgi:hypothetical protein